MQASITIGGLEVALTTRSGALEQLVAKHYAQFLGAVKAPLCSVTFESNRRDDARTQAAATLVDRVGETKFRVTRSGLFGLFDIAGAGVIDVAPTQPALDHALRPLFGLLAPQHDGLLLQATTVIGNHGAHVFMGASQCAAFTNYDAARAGGTDALVMIRREERGWLAASTPFRASYQAQGPAREDTLSRLWALEHAPGPGSDITGSRANFLEHTFSPSWDADVTRNVLRVVDGVVAEVPLTLLALDPLPTNVTDLAVSRSAR